MLMSKTTRTLNDQFEFVGMWFLPDAQEHHISGSLSYSRGNMYLKTIGQIEKSTNDNFISAMESAKKQHIIPTILGITATDEKVTLQKCVLTHVKYAIRSTDGMTSCQYRVQQMFIGEHFRSHEEATFDRVSTDFSNLKPWYGKSGIKRSQNSKIGIFAMEYNPVESTVVKIDDSYSLEIQVFESVSGSFHEKGFSVNEYVWLSIKNKELRPYRDFDDMNLCYRYFLMLAMLNTVHPIRITGSRNSQSVEIYPGINLYEKIPENIFPDKMLFVFYDVEKNFEEMIQAWRELWKDCKDPIITYFLVLLDHELARLEMQFQSIVLALESYHRLKFPDIKIPKEKYNVMIEDMKAKLKDNPMQIDFVEKFENMGNGFSLPKRLHSLIKISPETFANARKEKSDFVYKVSNTRNYYSHGSKELKEKAVLEADKLFNLIQEMKLLFECCLLKELHFSPDQIDKIMAHNRQVRNYAKDNPLK